MPSRLCACVLSTYIVALNMILFRDSSAWRAWKLQIVATIPESGRGSISSKIQRAIHSAMCRNVCETFY